MKKISDRVSKIMAVLLSMACFGWSSNLYAAYIVNDPQKDVQIIGQINPGDAERFKEVIDERYPLGSQYDWVFLDGPGGDIYEAMIIGNLIRQRGIYVSVQPGSKCYSSCVLILAGGVNRAIFGPVGVHRPYLSNVDEDTDIQEVYRSMIKDLKSYFSSMNVPVSLADLMVSVLPEKMRVLNGDEVAFYFPAEDPVADEIETAMEAKKRGITSSELRKRQAEAEVVCAEHVKMLEHGKATNDIELKFIAGTRLIWCREAASWGLSESEYSERNNKAKVVHESGTSTYSGSSKVSGLSFGLSGRAMPRLFFGGSSHRGKRQSIRAQGAGVISLWPAIIVLIVIFIFHESGEAFGFWSWAGFVISGLWSLMVFVDILNYQEQWLCSKCDASFVPLKMEDDDQSSHSISELAKVKEMSKGSRDKEPDGKICSICGKWHSNSEYKYGKRENRSYCRTCDREEKAAYSEGGAEAARKYRDEMRSSWKNVDS